MDVRGRFRARLYANALIAMLCLVHARAGYAQANGKITGTIVDNVGVVPGVTVTVTNPAAGLTRTAVSNAQGVFEIPSLPGANYTVKTSMEGFKEITMQVLLNAGENRDLGKLTLQAGGRTETVNVTAEVTPVQTTTSALQKNLTGDLLTSVQVKGRDVFGILKVLPGVADANPSRDFAQWNSGRYLSINGGNSLNKNTTIDGIPSGEEGGNGTTHITPNIDSVAEVNVIASGYTAENGRQASGQIIMVTKSGTNQLKGSGWYNYRRDWMNKNEFFRIKQGLEKPYFAVNIGGFSIGGPVVIPGVMDSRTSEKKTFFFGSTELTQDLRPTPATFTNLPTARERAGDFTQTFTGKATGDTAGHFQTGTQQPTAILNPQGLNNFYCAAGTGGISGVACNPTNTRTNIINPAYFNPLGVQMLNLLPLPNGITNQAADQFNNSNDRQDITPLHTRKNFVVRVDQVMSNKVRFSGRMLVDKDDSTTYNAMSTNVGSRSEERRVGKECRSRWSPYH